jgi:hypothetical protein
LEKIPDAIAHRSFRRFFQFARSRPIKLRCPKSMSFVTTEIAPRMDSQVEHVLLKTTHRMRHHASKVTHLLLTARSTDSPSTASSLNQPKVVLEVMTSTSYHGCRNRRGYAD